MGDGVFASKARKWVRREEIDECGPWPDRFKPEPRYKLYLFNIETGERQEPMAKHSTQLSLSEAKNACILSQDFAIKNDVKWVYKYEVM